jgi:hypothetical protein
VMDGCRVAGAPRSLDLAHMAVLGEHDTAELLPSRRRVPAITH